MRTLRFSKGDVKVTITRPFLLLDKVSLTNGLNGHVNVAFTLPFLNLNRPTSTILQLLNGLLHTVIELCLYLCHYFCNSAFTC